MALHEWTRKEWANLLHGRRIQQTSRRIRAQEVAQRYLDEIEMGHSYLHQSVFGQMSIDVGTQQSSSMLYERRQYTDQMQKGNRLCGSWNASNRMDVFRVLLSHASGVMTC